MRCQTTVCSAPPSAPGYQGRVPGLQVVETRGGEAEVLGLGHRVPGQQLLRREGRLRQKTQDHFTCQNKLTDNLSVREDFVHSHCENE